MNSTISLGVQPIILHSFSRVAMVMFPFFFKESNVLLSIPLFSSRYWDTLFLFMVSHIGP